MNKTTSLLLSLIITGSVHAEPTKIGVVNMERIYKDYSKTQANEAELEKDKAAARTEVEKRLKKFETIQKAAMELQATVNNTQLNAGQRQRAEKEFGEKKAELLSLQKDIEDFAKKRQAMIADKLRRMRTEILADLHQFVEAKSKQLKYDLVFDRSGVSTSGIEIMLFSKDAKDFTNDLLKIVNTEAGTAGGKKPESTESKDSELLKPEAPPTEPKLSVPSIPKEGLLDSK